MYNKVIQISENLGLIQNQNSIKFNFHPNFTMQK